jgi:hypothetical protein
MKPRAFGEPTSPAAIIEGIVEKDRLVLARRVDRMRADCIVPESGGGSLDSMDRGPKLCGENCFV